MSDQDRSQRKSRDKERTKSALIEATIALIRERGFEGLGVNAIAERAGVSKVLIYRYFGNLEGLFRAVAEALDPLHSANAMEILGSVTPPVRVSQILRKAVLLSHRRLKEDAIAKQLMVWELTHQNVITRVFSEAREKAGLKATKRLWEVAEGEDRLPGIDVNALLAVVMAGVYYLTLRSDQVADYNGVDIQSEEGWERIADAVAGIVALAERAAS